LLLFYVVFFVCLVCLMLPVSLDCLSFLAPSVSSVYMCTTRHESRCKILKLVFVIHVLRCVFFTSEVSIKQHVYVMYFRVLHAYVTLAMLLEGLAWRLCAILIMSEMHRGFIEVWSPDMENMKDFKGQCYWRLTYFYTNIFVAQARLRCS
jgi:hypothetical protein